MKRVLRKGFIVLTIYFTAVICTFLMTNRVQELDSNDSFRNKNKGLVVNFTR